jgi:5'-nucleotidase
LISPADAADVEEDPDVMSAIEAVKAENDLITSVVVGNTDVLLEGTRELVRTGETNLGNLITNAMLYETGAQIAITNGGGIRASIEPGEITVGDVITVLPFGNYIVTLDVTGADIIAALENGLTDYPDPKGAFPHVAGLTFTFDPTQPAYSRVVDVLVDGEPLDPAAVYSVATNDFMAAGGDEYTTLGASKQTGEFAALDEALISYIGVVDPATVQVEGRVSVAAEEEVTEEPAETVTETPAVSETYTVVSGDVLWKIAQKYGFTWQVIAEFNHMENPNLIYPGDEIQIPAQ